MKALPPSQRLQTNLLILLAARRTLFTGQGLSPFLLSTKMWFIRENNRISVAKLVLPLISDDNNRKIFSKAIEYQEQQTGWGQIIAQNESVWAFFRKAQIIPIHNQQIDDLMQLDYPRLLEGLNVPDKADVNLFWGGLTDFLINSWSVLEEFRLTSALGQAEEKESEEITKPERSPRVTKLIGWADMRFEHHLLNAVFRIRAGWDKLVDYLVVPYYGSPNISKNSWPKRLDRLNRELSSQLNSCQKKLWDNILENAKMIAVRGGLRDARDFELHKIALRSRETLGDKQRAPTLNQLESFTVSEHYRLQDNFILFIAMILQGHRST